jgi:uncharacterized protein (TIGR00288 family)
LPANGSDEQRIGLFIDFENIAIGVRDAHYRKFDVNLVLERLLEKGKVLVKKAYADWSRYSDYKRSFHEAAIELIEVPQKSLGGKNSADIRMVVDAMDMSFQKEHINCFVVASGDSDFSPLVSKLKENNKYVIGVGVKNSTSDLLIENCDEFIFYEDLVRGLQRQLPQIANVSEKVQEAFALLVDSIQALQRENKDTLWGSMVKETMKRKKPQFNETYFGFRTFSHMLEEAQRQGIVKLRRDQRSGSYIVEDLGSSGSSVARTEPAAAAANGATAAATVARPEAAAAVGASPAPVAGATAPAEGPRGRRRRGRGRGRGREISPLAAGAFVDAGGQSGDTGPDEGFGPESDDAEGDDMEDAPSASALSTEANPVPNEPSGHAAQSVPEPQPAEPARPAFSFLSWIRGDSARDSHAEDETPPPKRE